ncbi:MAG: PAS domain-containing protein, partial [Ferruginibacter sp.]
RNVDDTITGITVLATEVTAQVLAKKRMEASEKRFSNILSQSLMAICILKGRDLVITSANDSILEMWGKGKNIIGKTLIEVLPEIKDQPFLELLDNVYTTGVPFASPEIKAILIRNGKPDECYFNLVYSPYSDMDEAVTGITVFATEVTKQVLAKKQLEASEKRFNNILEQSLMAISIFKGKEMRIAFMNEPMIVMFGKGRDIIGKPLLEVLPELEGQPFPKLLDDVYTSGVPHYGYEMPGTLVRNGRAEETYFNFVYQPYREADNSITGITVIGTEVGPQVVAKKIIEASENQFRTFADSIQNLAWIANADGWIYWYNQRWYDYTGTTLEEMKGWGWEKLHHPDHAKEVTDFLKEAWKKDEAFELTFPLRRYDGEYRWFLTRAYPVKDVFGKIERWIGTNTDINEHKTAEQKKDEFISIASHEMKTPLTTAKGYIELLLLSLEEKDPIA